MKKGVVFLFVLVVSFACGTSSNADVKKEEVKQTEKPAAGPAQKEFERM